jgi:hypothetical protein
VRIFRLQSRLFGASCTSLSCLSGLGLLILASYRTAFALIAAGALAWVSLCAALIGLFARPILPERGRGLVFVALTAAAGSLYLLLLCLMNPFLAMESSLLVSLSPAYVLSLNPAERLASREGKGEGLRFLGEPVSLGVLIIALALIREPLGLGSLSLPGGERGITEAAGLGEYWFFPLGIISGSAGALFLLGYGIGVFQYLRNRKAGAEDPS